jgi:hypothetical protein
MVTGGSSGTQAVKEAKKRNMVDPGPGYFHSRPSRHRIRCDFGSNLGPTRRSSTGWTPTCKKPGGKSFRACSCAPGDRFRFGAGPWLVNALELNFDLDSVRPWG